MYTTEICRVFRGGTWRDFTSYAHTECWESIPISEVSDFIGIRLVEEVVALKADRFEQASELSRVVQGGCWYFDDRAAQLSWSGKLSPPAHALGASHGATGVRLVEVLDE